MIVFDRTIIFNACPRCHLVVADKIAHVEHHLLYDLIPADPSHGETCNWNLYRGQRGMYDHLCNLDCQGGDPLEPRS